MRSKDQPCSLLAWPLGGGVPFCFLEVTLNLGTRFFLGSGAGVQPGAGKEDAFLGSKRVSVFCSIGPVFMGISHSGPGPAQEV